MEAAFRPRGSAEFPAALTDLTRDGGCIETGFLLQVGADGWLHVPTLEDWHAEVVWQRGSRSGLAFTKPFHAAVMAMLVGRADGVPPVLGQSRHDGREFRLGRRRGSRRKQIMAGVVAPVHFRPWGRSADRQPDLVADSVSLAGLEQFRDCIGGIIDIRLRGRTSEAMIVDILGSGITVKSSVRPYIGETVAIELSDAESIDGSVIWWEEGCFAIRLVKPAVDSSRLS